MIKSQLTKAVCLKLCFTRVLSFNVPFDTIILYFLFIVMLMVFLQEENDIQGNSFTLKEEAHFSESDSEIGMFQNNDSSLDSLGRYIR